MEIEGNGEDFGAIEFPDELVEEIESQREEEGVEGETGEETSTDGEETTEEVEEGEEVENEEETTEEESEEEKGEEETETNDDGFVSDEAIYEQYGEDADPAIVRHYDIIKDYLLVGDDFKFNGSNIEEAYEEDARNRTNIVAQNIINDLPEAYQEVLGDAINGGKDLTPETLDALMLLNKEKMTNTFDESDVDSMKAYVKQKLIARGESAGDADDIIELYEEKGTLKSRATLLKKEDDARIASEKKALADKDLSDAQSRRDSSKALFDGVNSALESTEFKARKKQEIKSYIFSKPKNSSVSPLVANIKNIYNDPKALVMLADMVSYYDVENKTWDLKGIENRVASKVTKKVKSSINSKLSGSAFKQKTVVKKIPKVTWDDVSL